MPCLLGCTHGVDEQIHYLQCPHLFAICNYFFKVDSVTRIGLRNPTINNLRITACVFTAYHMLKAQVRDGLLNGMHKDARTIHPAWSVFADALEAAAGEHHLPFVVFSLPKFISFLINGHVHDSNSPPHHVVQNAHVEAVGNAAVLPSHDNTACSLAPGSSSSRAGSSVFVRAAHDNAHNPILHPPTT